MQKQKAASEVDATGSFPHEPRRDVLKFLLENAPLASWHRRVLKIVRDEAYYFAPQGQTKILNEGWATYWHSEMMTKLSPLSPEGLIDYCDNHAGVLASAPGGFNPYKIGLELLRYVKMRWDKGRFGLEYLHCTDPIKKKNWDTGAGEGMERLFEIRRTHNDVTFLQEYLDEGFCHDSKLFLYDKDKSGEWVVSSRDFKEIKTHLLRMLTNFGQPVIKVVDGNYKNRGELLLQHIHEGVDLDDNYAQETLKALSIVWGKPVNIRTIVDGNEKVFTAT
jgi:stage V sporulation protein R